MEGARADVLIETLMADATGAIAAWPWHAARLTHSAAALGFAAVPGNVHEQVLAQALPGQPNRIRLLFARDGAVTIEAAPLGALALPARARLAQQVLGAHAVLRSQEPLLRHKLTYRPWYAEATAWLATHPADFDLLFANERGELCEGSRTNVYVKQDGVWLTPDLTAGCLPGTQRAALLAQGHVRTARLTLDDLRDAQATRLSNGLRGWFDVEVAWPEST